MFKKGICGGTTHVVKCHANSINNYMVDLYNPDKTSAYVQCLEAINLYGGQWSTICEHMSLNGQKSMILPLEN